MAVALVAPRKTQWSGTTAQIAQALADTHGMVSVAARKIGCNRRTIQRYAKSHESVREALQDARELMTDTAELALYKAIRDGEAWAVCFYLKTQGKQRGYVERVEHTGQDGGPVAVSFTVLIQRAGEQDASDSD